MALKTFKNLRLDRQEEIIQLSFEEFALKGYQSTSLSEIIKKLGLAKGSFYRYFTNKKELYAFLIQEASVRRLSKLERLINQPGMDFFELIRQNFIDKLTFDLENPTIGGFLYQVMHEKDNSEVADIINRLYETVILQTKHIITLDQFRNQLSVDDPEMVAFQIFHTQLWLYDYLAYKYNLNYQENIINHKPVLSLPQYELERVIDLSVQLLKSGIQKR